MPATDKFCISFKLVFFKIATGSTLPITEMSTRNLLGGEERPARKTDNFAAIWETTVYKICKPQRLFNP
jgi:hypothetical protein